MIDPNRGAWLLVLNAAYELLGMPKADLHFWAGGSGNERLILFDGPFMLLSSPVRYRGNRRVERI